MQSTHACEPWNRPSPTLFPFATPCQGSKSPPSEEPQISHPSQEKNGSETASPSRTSSSKASRAATSAASSLAKLCPLRALNVHTRGASSASEAKSSEGL